MKHRTTLLLTATALFVMATGCGKKEALATSTLADTVLNIRTADAGKRVFERKMTVQGSLSSDKSAVVASRIDGNLDAVFVDLGDVVKKDETKLFAIDPVALQSRVLIAECNVNTAKAQELVAEATARRASAEQKKAVLDFDRYERLHKDARVSDNEYEQIAIQRESGDAAVAIAEATIELYKQQVAQFAAALAIARRNLSDATVFAPLDGIVGERFMEPGEQAKQGAHIIRINGVQKIKASAYLPASYYEDVVPGKTEFKLFVDKTDRGLFKVTAKSPAVDMQLRTFEFRGLVEDQAWAIPGKMADFEVVFESHEGIAVPDEAILVRQVGSIVFVENQGVVNEVVIKTDLRNAGFTEVIEGLTGGEHIVVEGQSQLYDGRKVAVVK